MTRVAIAVLLLGALGAPLAAAQRPSPLVLVLDASGSMWGEVRGEAKIVDATLSVRRAGKAIEAGRTYKSPSSNPKRFTLAPGDYEVEINEIRGERRTIGVTITAGAELTRTVDLATAAE